MEQTNYFTSINATKSVIADVGVMITEMPRIETKLTC